MKSWIPPSHLRAIATAIPEGVFRYSGKAAGLKWVAENYCGGCGGPQDAHRIDCPAVLAAMKQLERAA